MSLAVVHRPYDAGAYAGAKPAESAVLAPGMIVYVTQCLSGGLFEVTPDRTNRRALGIVTHVTADGMAQVQTDGTLTLRGLSCPEPKHQLAVGNSVCWDPEGTVLRSQSANSIGYVLHRTPFTVRLQITHA